MKFYKNFFRTNILWKWWVLLHSIMCHVHDCYLHNVMVLQVLIYIL